MNLSQHIQGQFQSYLSEVGLQIGIYSYVERIQNSADWKWGDYLVWRLD